MRRGRLRVLLGAAPGVGKTYTMLEEGARLAAEGKDVVIAVVETHGRVATAALVRGLELVPRLSITHRGIELTEMDLDGVLERRPDIVLVDELAHTNAPGSANEQRWQDTEELLAAGIDVISTVNVQHIESLNDVVQQITGAPQRETVPDAALRAADQIEVIDVAPQALRDRLASGHVYPAENVDAALSNYFRLGNLTALRELTLIWLAGEVDSALNKYRADHGIGEKWAARERVVVALTGGPEGETLIRRGARIAARFSAGEFLAVHVSGEDGLRVASPGALVAQRTLVENLGGSYHQVVGDDIPHSLVEFAKASNATQLVLGVSRRSRLVSMMTGPGIGATVIRESGNIDVHIVTHAAAGDRFALPRMAGGALTLRRRALGLLLALIGGPLLTLLLISFRGPDSLTTDALAYESLVIVVALVGGIWPALFAAILSGFTLDFLFVEPYNTVTVGEPLHFVTLTLYVLNAVAVSYIVDQAARSTRAALRAAAESELLATVAGGVLRGGNAIQALVSRTREAFGLTGVRLLTDDRVLCADGEPDEAEPAFTVPVGNRATLELRGANLQSSERRILSVITAQLDTALEHHDLAETAREMAPLAETDRVRSALLSAVSHDLRRPLTAARTSVANLQDDDIAWTEEEKRNLLHNADDSLRNLSDLVNSLLDVTRLQAGVLAVATAPTDVDSVILAALDELGFGPGDLVLDLAPDLTRVLADPVLLQRVVVNLLLNANRFSPPETAIRLSTSHFAAAVQIRVIDRGPGIAEERREEVFQPFQRLGDTDNNTGLGLGLALSKGFAEGMGGTLEAEDTPGGGLTMVITLPDSDPLKETL